MDITALFPSPVATFFDFITEEERLQIFESIMSVEHPPHGAIAGKGFSTHTKALQEDVRSSTIVSGKIIDRMQDAVEMNSEFRIKWPRGELGALPDDAKQDLRIEYLQEALAELKAEIQSLKEKTDHKKLNVIPLKND